MSQSTVGMQRLGCLILVLSVACTIGLVWAAGHALHIW